jgi:hypothetical protein
MVNTAWDLTDRLAHEHPRGCSVISITLDKTPTPDLVASDRLRKFAEAYAEKLACVLTVVLGSGSSAGLQRVFITGLMWFARRRFKSHTCGSIDEGASWFAGAHGPQTGVTLPATEIARVMNQAS